MLGRPLVALPPSVGRSSTQAPPRPLCRLRGPGKEQDCQLRTVCALLGRRGDEEEQGCSTESLVSASKTLEHFSGLDIHHHLLGRGEVHLEEEVGSLVGSPLDLHRLQRAGLLASQEAARSRSRNLHLRRRSPVEGRPLPRRKQECLGQ